MECATPTKFGANLKFFCRIIIVVVVGLTVWIVDRYTLSERAMAEPPPYAEATKESRLVPNAALSDREAPPAYDQLFGISDIRDAKRDSQNKVHFFARFCEIVTGTIACAICMIILAALPVAMIVIGSVYLHDCPGRRLIPIWLIVFGCVSMVQFVIDMVKRCFKTRNDDDNDGSNRERYAGRSGSCLESLISFFLFIWIIIGSSWVFGYYSTFRDCEGDSSGDCCHPVPFYFSFVTLIVIYTVTILMCCCCCFCVFCAAFFAGAAASSEDD